MQVEREKSRALETAQEFGLDSLCISFRRCHTEHMPTLFHVRNQPHQEGHSLMTPPELLCFSSLGFPYVCSGTLASRSWAEATSPFHRGVSSCTRLCTLPASKGMSGILRVSAETH